MATTGDVVPPGVELRQTPEYRAAWDIELWKAVQVQKFQKTMRDRERKANEQLKASCAQKEKDAMASIERRQKDLTVKHVHLEEESILQEKRKQRLIEAEKELKRKFAEVESFRKRVEQEADDRVQRFKDECTHRVELCLLKQRSTEELLAKAEERQAASQKEYLRLWHEFSDFKTKALSDGGMIGSQLDAMRAQHATELASFTERHERRLQEMIALHERKVDELHAECKRLNVVVAQKREHNRTLNAEVQLLKVQRDEAHKELQHLRKQLAESTKTHITRHHIDPSSKASTSPEIDALLQSIERQQARVELQQQASQNRQPGKNLVSASASQAAHGAEGPALAKEIRTEIERWEAEKDRLLRGSGGAYDNDSPIIQDLTKRIVQAHESLRGLSNT